MTTNFLGVLEEDLADDPVLVAGAPRASDVGQIEVFAGFPLPSEYRAFVKKYGAAVVGPYSIYGVDAWLDWLEAEYSLFVTHSSGTTGRLSLILRD